MDNSVELLGFYGGDYTHAQSAWSSTNREMTPDKIERIPQLLKKLKEGSDGNPHGSPFEKSALHFLVTSDIASHIHLIKHRIAVSVNAESARYKELKDDKYYVPVDWPENVQKALVYHMDKSYELYHKVIADLVKDGMDRKRAKESARFFLPYANQITSDVQFNFRSFTTFCKLRAKPSAQLEIREIAKEMIRLTMNIDGNPFEHSIKAWGLDEFL